MPNVNNLRRNPFWQIIEQELPFHHYKKYEARATENGFILLIQGVSSNNEPATQQYHFPRVCRSFESQRNFRSKLRNFLKRELPERGFFPFIDQTRIRKPGMYIQKINHDVPKKELTTPKPMLQEIAKLKPQYDDIIAPPYIPEPRPKTTEPVSDTKVLAMFLMDVKDLSTLVDVASDIAKFKGSKPAPLRLVGEVPVAPTPIVVVAPPVVEVQEPEPVVRVRVAEPIVKLTPMRRARSNVREQVLQKMLSKPTKHWTASELSDLGKVTSINTYLSILNQLKKIKRVAPGKYKVA